jgi:hypothetical protein
MSASENSSISNNRGTIPMHTAYCFDLQRSRKNQGTRIKRKGLKYNILKDLYASII